MILIRKAISATVLITILFGSAAFASNESECLKLDPKLHYAIRRALDACVVWANAPDAEWHGVNEKLGLGIWGGAGLTATIHTAAKECAGGLGRGCPAAIQKLYDELAPLRGAQGNAPQVGHFVDIPAICGIRPISTLRLEEYQRDPIYGPVAKAFIAQTKKLAHDSSIFGEVFHAYNPDPHVGYANTYAVDATSSGKVDDKTQRELIRTSLDFSGEPDPFRELYSLQRAEWHPERAHRVSGFTFSGFKTPPDEYQKRCGLWAQLFGIERGEPNTRTFEKLFEIKRGRRESAGEAPPTFDLPFYIQNPANSIFRSTSRSVWVARRFALTSEPPPKEGWVYVILVHNGFDFRDRNVVPNPVWITGEQEISVPGMIPWSDIVGYRKILLEPSPGAPPELAGPVYLREGLESLEPDAFVKIMQTLSTKSKYTQDFDQGRPWKGKADR